MAIFFNLREDFVTFSRNPVLETSKTLRDNIFLQDVERLENKTPKIPHKHPKNTQNW